jgi:uncharacterized protein (TIGR02284 family)
MTTSATITEVLQDLVKINEDRIKGYETAGDDIEKYDEDLKAVFVDMADQSMENVDELQEIIESFGGKEEDNSSLSGSIHRVWMDMKAMFTGKDRLSILNSCEYGEDAILKAYDSALASDAEIDAVTRQVITTQRSSLKQSHDQIKKYRDLNKAMA